MCEDFGRPRIELSSTRRSGVLRAVCLCHASPSAPLKRAIQTFILNTTETIHWPLGRLVLPPPRQQPHTGQTISVPQSHPHRRNTAGLSIPPVSRLGLCGRHRHINGFTRRGIRLESQYSSDMMGHIRVREAGCAKPKETCRVEWRRGPIRDHIA